MWIKTDSNDWLKRKKIQIILPKLEKQYIKITTNIMSEEYRISGLYQSHFFSESHRSYSDYTEVQVIHIMLIHTDQGVNIT